MTERGFRAEILTGPYHAPNGGISATARFVTIVGDNVPDDMRQWTADKDAPAVRLDDFPFRVFKSSPPENAAHIGPMASGAFVHSEDSRWVRLTNGYGPVPLHDRYESVELYNTLSS